MAEIALLVVEEYERGIKNSRKGGGEGSDLGVNWVSSCVSDVAKSVKNNIREENLEIVKWVLEPKTQIGLAASDGFFSA